MCLKAWSGSRANCYCGFCVLAAEVDEGQEACETAGGSEAKPDPNKASSVTRCQLALKIAASVALGAKQVIISLSLALLGDTSDVRVMRTTVA